MRLVLVSLFSRYRVLPLKNMQTLSTRVSSRSSTSFPRSLRIPMAPSDFFSGKPATKTSTVRMDQMRSMSPSTYITPSPCSNISALVAVGGLAECYAQAHSCYLLFKRGVDKQATKGGNLDTRSRAWKKGFKIQVRQGSKTGAFILLLQLKGIPRPHLGTSKP